jgi:hypothetical protein
MWGSCHDNSTLASIVKSDGDTFGNGSQSINETSGQLTQICGDIPEDVIDTFTRRSLRTPFY